MLKISIAIFEDWHTSGVWKFRQVHQVRPLLCCLRHTSKTVLILLHPHHSTTFAFQSKVSKFSPLISEEIGETYYFWRHDVNLMIPKNEKQLKTLNVSKGSQNSGIQTFSDFQGSKIFSYSGRLPVTWDKFWRFSKTLVTQEDLMSSKVHVLNQILALIESSFAIKQRSR